MSVPEDPAQEPLADNGFCFGCGPANPIGLHLTFDWDDQTGDYIARYHARPEDQGWVGRVHGGLLAVVFDEVLSRVVLAREGYRWVTAELTTRFQRPVRIGETVLFRARVLSRRSRLIISAGEAYTQEGDLVATGQAKMMPAPAEKLVPVATD